MEPPVHRRPGLDWYNSYGQEKCPNAVNGEEGLHGLWDAGRKSLGFIQLVHFGDFIEQVDQVVGTGITLIT